MERSVRPYTGLRIAVYGKGGIGKSTISSNISAALADMGHSVLQIGCDPKHDSTRALLGTLPRMTVTEYLMRDPCRRGDMTDLIGFGYRGVACIEAGGPEPGFGCAGRGILSTFELIGELGKDGSPYAYTIYDVLGDVVCGGFAVPLRQGYADIILIVTSGEYMSLYAANNILRGIRAFDGEEKRIAGMIHNSRGSSDETGQILRFSGAVHLPILATIPRSDVILAAERISQTVVAAFPDSYEASCFRDIASLFSKSDQALPLHQARPLPTPELEHLVLGREMADQESATSPAPTPHVDLRKADQRIHTVSPTSDVRAPLFGCAFAGAAAVLSEIGDAAIVLHAPQSCTHIVSHLLASGHIRRARRSGCQVPLSLYHTLMSESDVIFGGEQVLCDSITKALSEGAKAVFVVTSCVPGITGDDVRRCISSISRPPHIPIIPVLVDGVGKGDFAAGTEAGYHAALSLLSPSPDESGRSVLFAGEKVLTDNIDLNAEELAGYLNDLGISVACRFLADTCVDELSAAGSAALILPAFLDEGTVHLCSDLAAVTSGSVLSLPFPHSFEATEAWLMAVAEQFGLQDQAAALCQEKRGRYEREIAAIREQISGKSVLLSTSGADISWVAASLHDCGVHILRTGLFNSLYTYDIPDHLIGPEVVRDYTAEQLYSDIADLRPDLVLTTIWLDPKRAACRYGIIPFCTGTGFFAAIPYLRSWVNILSGPCVEGWRKDL